MNGLMKDQWNLIAVLLDFWPCIYLSNTDLGPEIQKEMSMRLMMRSSLPIQVFVIRFHPFFVKQYLDVFRTRLGFSKASWALLTRCTSMHANFITPRGCQTRRTLMRSRRWARSDLECNFNGSAVEQSQTRNPGCTLQRPLMS